MERALSQKFYLKMIAGYQQRSLAHVNRPNPPNGPSFTTYPELATEIVDVSFASAYLTIFPSFAFDLLSFNWRVGLALRAQYFLNSHSIEFSSGPQKTVKTTQQVGYDQFELELSPRIEIHVLDWLYVFVQVNNRVVPSFDLLLEPAGGLGFQF